ncbi:MAG: PBP1A family penicillin-binding protein [Thermodesulfobacteriota bacterium]
MTAKPKKKKAKKKKTVSAGRSLMRKGLIGLFLLGLVCLALSLTYGWYLSGRIETRFAGRKWNIPSTVYSDAALLFPGKRINRFALEKKLQRLNYRATEAQPAKKGEYRLTDRGLEIFFHDLPLPDKKREGFPADITIQHGAIREIRHIGAKHLIPVAELEPEVIMRFLGQDREVRRVISFEDIPDTLVKAVMAAEDSRFFRHFGIDPIGMLRALFANVRSGAVRQGGSTLTQQLAKNYFLTPERTLSRKFKEFFIALVLEAKYSKEKILEIYLNEIYFGQQGSVSINGAGEAADFYFGKDVKDLGLPESAMLAGIIKGPNLYSPYTHPDNCRERRDQVLAAMLEKAFISREEHDRAVKEPVNTVAFRKYMRRAPYFLDYVSRQIQDLYPEATLSSHGFSIFTTLDVDVQEAAEKALGNGLTRLEKQNPSLTRTDPQKKLQGAVLVMQPRTGNILAMAGGRDYGESQFNRVTSARRQPGSCFKPVITACFLDMFKPSDRLSNEKRTYTVNGKPWTPENYENVPEKSLTVRDMLRLSCNRAAVDLVVRGGVESVANRLRPFNFSTDFPPYPSIVLGAIDVIPLELARAYCAFAADGVQPFPLSVRDISDESGHVLVRRHMTISPVLSPARAWLITSMLESVVGGGTARSLKKSGLDFPLAGKTGTTSNYRDAWFIGYTPDFLALVWVGFDNGEPVSATGAEAAIPIFAELVKSMPGYVSGKEFAMPPGIVKQTVCRQSGKLPVLLSCPETDDEYFLETNQPKEKCDLHGATDAFKKVFNGLKKLFQ